MSEDTNASQGTITVDGIAHEIAGLTEGQRELIGVYNIWRREAQTQRVELAKTETAYEAMAQRIAASIRSNVEAGVAPTGETDTTATADVDTTEVPAEA